MTASQQQPLSAITLLVKTKNDRRQDVGGPTVEVAREPGHQTGQPILKVQDPFLYYSNDQVRMKELRFLQDEEVDSSDDDSSYTSLSNQAQPTTTYCARKTRISFELHPSLLLEDLMTDDEFLGDDSLNFNDIFDASLRAANDYDNEQDDYDVVDAINSLRQIMFG